MSRRSAPFWLVLLIVTLVAAVVCAALAVTVWRRGQGPAPSGPPVVLDRATFVGSEACRQCHEPEFNAWMGSHHQQAMQIADDSTVLGDFRDAKFEHFGVETTFTRREGKFIARTDGPDGRLADYEVKYTFGVEPLQQYLVEFPGGRYQALSVAWDSRPSSAGGQRWFHLYPDEKVDPTDQLHWTGRYQNWNLMCAECHSTNVRKRYDAATDTYRTTFSEINVSCESCHGPGSRHVRWANNEKAGYQGGADMGLVVRLVSDWGTAWSIPTLDARFPVRNTRAPAAVLNVCAACHARRSTLAEAGMPGPPLEETHRLAMLTNPLYFPDGQQHEEVYEWGSFLQSRMYQRGVTCMDCHEPHTAKVRFEGNTLCARCHSPAIFDGPKHHFHEAGTPGSSCVACHMPTRNYMVVHARLDHSLRLPRPDLSAKLGSSDACTACHTDRKPEWAADAMDGWYGTSWRSRPHWGDVLHQGQTLGTKAATSLRDLARAPETPPIIRATAATLLRDSMRPAFLPDALALLTDLDPSVRIAGLGLLEPFDPATRLDGAGPLLGDSVRGVRIEAARLLADVPDRQLSPAQLGHRGAALEECLAALRLNEDWPAENVNRGNLALRRGRADEAIAAFERAIALDDRFVGAYANLADTLRQLGRDPEGEAVLRRGLAAVPESADLHHALGLLLVRKRDTIGALEELARAAALAPGYARYAYVHAVALHTSGRVDEALDVLRTADHRSPYDPDVLGTLISILRERRRAGDAAEALGHARKLAEAMPESAEIRRLIEQLEQDQ